MRPPRSRFDVAGCRRWTALFAAGVMLLGACSGEQEAMRAREALLQADRDFARLSAEKGPAEAFNAYLDEEALQLPDAGLPVRGRQVIYEGLAAAPGLSLLWEPQEALVAESGELGYTWGTYVARFAGGQDEPVVSHGKYLNIWKKNQAGEWKVLVDMGNKSPAPQAPRESGSATGTAAAD